MSSPNADRAQRRSALSGDEPRWSVLLYRAEVRGKHPQEEVEMSVRARDADAARVKAFGKLKRDRPGENTMWWTCEEVSPAADVA